MVVRRATHWFTSDDMADFSQRVFWAAVVGCVLSQLPAHRGRGAEAIQIVTDAELAPRVAFGVARLEAALSDAGAAVSRASADAVQDGNTLIVIGRAESTAIQALAAELSDGVSAANEQLGPEGFRLAGDGARLAVVGGGDSGVLYGCLELARRVRESGALPRRLDVTERPALRLRGTCIGMQKPYRLPGRQIYEYPYTEELFPFFYDKTAWLEYLDFLVERRMNLLSLWNGHPFGSLVRVADYPEAIEVSPEQFERNVAMYRFIAEEADRRGIWVTQMFYNILLPKPLADAHGLETQLGAPTPLAADYTRQAIAEFVRMYPNVGLHVCLGEAMLDPQLQREWLVDVILPGVQDGMHQAGLREEPPVMIRAHATDASVVIPAGMEIYKNIYTESKYNGESLTTWQPRGPAAAAHRQLAELGSTHVVNVHILANLEPFRYGAQRFIRRSVQAARNRLGAGGLHVYPLSYWNWPVAPDATEPPLLQIQRDAIWFDAWARYAWDPDIDADMDRAYWVGKLAEQFGSAAAAPLILDAYNDAGECAPRLIRRLGITEGNRQTLSLGMTLDQLVDPQKYNAWPDLWQSQAPPGERLQEYVQREWDGLPHEGETPPIATAEAVRFAQQAVAALDAAAPLVAANRDEFDRLHNDCRCILAMCRHYQAKADAARLVLRHRLSDDPRDLQQALQRLADSVAHYRELVQLTDETYRFANSMQIGHRRIPVRGEADGQPAYFHWRQVAPLFEQELREFRQRLIGQDSAPLESRELPRLASAEFELIGTERATFKLEPSARPFADSPAAIKAVAPPLMGLVGVRTDFDAATGAGEQPIELETAAPVRVLVGYFRSNEPGWRRPTNPDFDARAHERNAAEPVLTDAVTLDGLPPVDAYQFTLPAGRHRWAPPGAGRFLLLGFAAAGP